ncbi:MAG: phosphoglucosamine mutase [Candidatus Eisenbacteria sp.]|nr:phosphoglucosamine mutase [Candidatus Eisenbacteria bacterium]
MPTLILGISGARGIVGDGLDATIAARLAVAYVGIVGAGPILLGRDSRPSGLQLGGAVSAALQTAGCSVTELGVVPTPTVQVAVEELGARGGIVITASHNPPAWNALKFIGRQGTFLAPAPMERLITLFQGTAPGTAVHGEQAAFLESDGTTATGKAMIARHVERIVARIPVTAIRQASLAVVVDAVHGAGQVLVAPLLERLGVRAAWIAGEPDGNLPARPEPRAERLTPLAEAVERDRANLGFALDPDGDRCAPVLPGQVLGEEWCLPLCAYEMLAGGARGSLVTNQSTSARLEWLGEHYGVALVRTPVGEAHVVGRMQGEEVLLGGEGNGGVIDPRVHLGRDAGVAIARLLALETRGPAGAGGVAQAAAAFPQLYMAKRELDLARSDFPALIKGLERAWGAPEQRDDGGRWVWEDGWLHVRPSGTEPVVRVIAESREEPRTGERVAHVLAIAAKIGKAPAGSG